MNRSIRSSAGFSLIELLITVAVAAIVLTIAIPGFNGLIYSSRLSSITNEYVGAIKQAQLEAIKHNDSVQFCSNSSTNNNTDTLGTFCTAVGAGGVMMVNRTGGLSLQIQAKPAVPTNILIGDGSGSTAAVTALRFNGNGLATTATGTTLYSGLVADLYTTQINNNNHRCIYMATGNSLSSCIVTGAAGICPTNEPTSCKQ